ncbi:dipeptidyl aminopeptidase/acylaminoacyl peptidase [Natronospira proteinivora]|uniref:Dipeptidyl aminopeptidase/acylaminoacyl peptidase n=1 Tax=Natronospira proteinivora TaxID=1807133 RepID=A0ABT1G9Q4_9GAMM|nr:S9 family peptidase [Natronospira proteinivora]MCP1728042.1 dipeptidyl aminopeptidase/acylaminoacyl peptidase [Natronospira proteinivora]
MLMRKSLLALVLLSVGLVACAATPNADPLEAESLWHWAWAGDARLSPDGERLVYVRTQVDREQDRYQTSLWLKNFETGRHRALTTHEANDGNPRWSPDGERIAFTSGRREGSQIWMIELAGGEAQQLTELEGGAGTPVWSPDGDKIAFSSRALTETEREEKREKENEQRQAQREARDLDDGDDMESAPSAFVTEDLRYQVDGRADYLPEESSHLWIVATDADADWPQKPRRVTEGDDGFSSPAWSADGDYLLFSGLLEEDADWRIGESHLYRVAVSGEDEPEQLTEGRRNRGNPLPSPDGRWIAFTGNEYQDTPKSYTLTELYVMPADGGEETRLTGDYDRGVADGTSGDMSPPTGGGDRLHWGPDSEALYFTSAVDGQTQLARVARDGGSVEALTDYAAGDLGEFSLSGDRFSLLWASPRHPFDLYTVERDAVASRDDWDRVTRLNEQQLGDRALPGYEEVWYDSFDDEPIQGWVIRPDDFDPNKEYPAILYIHGGPHAMYGTTFFHEFQTLADAGYVVLITNPRGSSGYGQDFGNIIQHRYPGDDYKDLMAGVDWLLDEGYVDEDRLGVTGGSGGGLLTAWTVTQTDRFAAAAAQRSVINWHSFVGTADMNYFFVERWFPAPPWEDPMHYIERSPLAYVDQVKTPIMLIHSEQDWRTPLEQTQQFYAQLRMQQKPAKLVIFPEVSHGLSRTGRPSQRVERLNHIRDWFDQYLNP